MAINANADVRPVAADSSATPSMGNEVSMTIRSWIWTASSAMASIAAAIVMMKGIRRGQVGAIAMGTLLLFGSSEFTDYPMASTLWNRSEPIFRQVGETTKKTLSDVSVKASESATASLRYLGWLLAGALVIGGVSWWFAVRAIEAVIKRARRVKEVWHGQDAQNVRNAAPTVLTTNEVNANPRSVAQNAAAAPFPLSHTANGTLSGATSGEDSGEDKEASRQCQPNRITYDNNYLRPMNQAVCKREGIMKTDLLHGDCLVMGGENVVSDKHGRVEVLICKKHFEAYADRRADVGCEQNDCYGRGVLVKIGDKAMRECNEHIGMRLLQENQKDAAEQNSMAPHDQTSAKPSTAHPVIVVEEGKSLEQHAEDQCSSLQLECPLPTAATAQQEIRAPGDPMHAFDAVHGKSSTVTATKRTGKTVGKALSNVEFADPVETEPDTSSDAEEEHLEKIRGNRGETRRLSVEAISSKQSYDKDGKKAKTGKRAKAYNFEDECGLEATGSKRGEFREASFSDSNDSSSSSSSSEDSSSDDKRRHKKTKTTDRKKRISKPTRGI